MTLIFILLLSTGARAFVDVNSPDLLKERCRQREAPAVTGRDFHWSYSLPALIEKAFEIKTSGKRLSDRAFYDESRGYLVLPHKVEYGGFVRLNELFVHSVRRHVEEALRLRYVHGIFFPDMGHSHLLLPQARWDEHYRDIPVRETSRRYEEMFADTEIKILYHTAEQLKMTDESGQLLPDRELQWRFYSRNLVGDNRGDGRLELLQSPASAMNTVSGVEGYRWWGAGFYLSESDQGCIAFENQGQTRYFDISLQFRD